MPDAKTIPFPRSPKRDMALLEQLVCDPEVSDNTVFEALQRATEAQLREFSIITLPVARAAIEKSIADTRAFMGPHSRWAFLGHDAGASWITFYFERLSRHLADELGVDAFRIDSL